MPQGQPRRENNTPLKRGVRGKVKWFNDVKGFGFISRYDDKAADDVFVHFTGISGVGFKTLAEGDEVIFDIVSGKKGFQAENVVKD